MVIPHARDVFLYRNMPYGYWKSGHPFVKGSCIIIGVLGTFMMNTSLILQSSAICLLLLYMPTFPKSKILNILLNFGVGSSIVLFLGSNNISRIPDRIYTLKFVSIFNLKMIFAILVLMFVLFKIRKAITSRDIAWLIDKFPRRGKSFFSSAMYAYVFGMLRGPATLRDLNSAFKSRGGCSFLGRKTCKKAEAYIDLIGIWTLNLLRSINDMASSIEYILVSRIKIFDRSNPAKWAWTEVDYSIFAVILTTVLIPRIAPIIMGFFSK